MAKKKKLFLLMVFTLAVFILIIYNQFSSGLSTPRAYLMHLVLGNTSLHSDRDSETLMTEYIQRREGNTSLHNDSDTESLMTEYLQRRDRLSIHRNNYANRTCKDKDAGPCVNVTCNSTFPPLHERLQNIFHTQYKVSDVHLDLLKSLGTQVPPADLVFLAAASENHFEESQGVIKDLHEKVFPWLESSTNYTYTFIYYDLGLANKSATMTMKHCRCQVLPFPFQSLDSVFSRLNTYKWKPLIVKAHIERSKLLIYMDASVRFVTGNIQGLIHRAMDDGFVIFRDGLMLPGHVMPPMLEYFRVEPCLLGPFYETEANFFMVKNELLMNKVLIDPWTSCAFAPRCIYPGDNWLSLLPCGAKNGGYSRCHRFDQAGLGVLLVMLFDLKSTQLVERDGNIQIRRGNKVKYFPEN